MSKKISFQGVEGAYSHLAVKEFFPNSIAVPCKTFEIAIKEADKLNLILDDMHNMLHNNASKKAA